MAARHPLEVKIKKMAARHTVEVKIKKMAAMTPCRSENKEDGSYHTL